MWSWGDLGTYWGDLGTLCGVLVFGDVLGGSGNFVDFYNMHYVSFDTHIFSQVYLIGTDHTSGYSFYHSLLILQDIFA